MYDDILGKREMNTDEEIEIHIKPKKALDVIYVDFIVTSDGEIKT